MRNLGGRRKVQLNSKNTRWKNISFCSYADYVRINTFKKVVARLEDIVLQIPTVYMCARLSGENANVRWCRLSESKRLDNNTYNGGRKVQEHSYTSQAKVVGAHVSYED